MVQGSLDLFSGGSMTERLLESFDHFAEDLVVRDDRIKFHIRIVQAHVSKCCLDFISCRHTPKLFRQLLDCLVENTIWRHNIGGPVFFHELTQLLWCRFTLVYLLVQSFGGLRFLSLCGLLQRHLWSQLVQVILQLLWRRSLAIMCLLILPDIIIELSFAEAALSHA